MKENRLIPSQPEPNPWPLVNKIPKPLRWSFAAGSVVLAGLVAACGGGGDDAKVNIASNPSVSTPASLVGGDFQINPCRESGRFKPEYLTEDKILAACIALLYPEGLNPLDPKNRDEIRHMTDWMDPQIPDSKCEFMMTSHFEEKGVGISSSIAFCPNAVEAGRLLSSDRIFFDVSHFGLSTFSQNAPPLGEESSVYYARGPKSAEQYLVYRWRYGGILAGVIIDKNDFRLLTDLGRRFDERIRGGIPQQGR